MQVSLYARTIAMGIYGHTTYTGTATCVLQQALEGYIGHIATNMYRYRITIMTILVRVPTATAMA